MTFENALQIVKTALSNAGTKIDERAYDGLIVKRLVASNTLDDGRTTNQTHIAITGAQMDIFPYLCADGYFYENGKIHGTDLKKYFVISIPVTLFESNCNHLGIPSNSMLFKNGKRESSTCVVRSKREAQSDQLQLSMLNMDGADFVEFRKAMHSGTFFIMLKCKSSMQYHVFGINPLTHPEDESALMSCNNQFFRDLTNTVVAADSFNSGNSTGMPSTAVGGAENIIFYGVPGCGKSYKIKSEYCNDDKYMERVVFHPDFTYSDFVGQILPTTDGDKISYPFVPGPFTRILKTAVADPAHNYYLIIEEINRGNAPAIFGEVFQLLDRENGESEYGITNSDIAAQVYFDESGTALPNHKVKIPANLFILATMNTADQNVFTLDTAFKRRWKMVSVKNEIANCDHANNPICGTNVTWASFATAINSKIIEVGEGNLSSEDNRLGAYFVKADDLTDVDVFSEKVLMYLWNDAFKFDREKVFKPEYKTLDQLIDGFKNNLFDVFSGEFSFDSSSPSISGDDVGNTEAITVSAFLNDKTQSQVDLYSALKEYISGIVSGVSDGATRNYIALKQNGTNIAEIHFLKNEVQINTKQPQQGELRIGTLLPDTYRWSNNYRITLTSDNLQIVGDAIIDAYGLLG